MQLARLCKNTEKQQGINKPTNHELNTEQAHTFREQTNDMTKADANAKRKLSF